jgi:UrcA family protein
MEVSIIHVPRRYFMTHSATVRSPSLKLKSALLLLTGGLAVAAAAGAAPADSDVPQLAVRYSEASLNTDAGAQALYQRIVRAAEKVCDPNQAGSRLPSAAEMKCRAQAVSSAIEKVHNPRLVAVSSSSKAG